MISTIYGLFWFDSFDEKCFWIGRTTLDPPQRRWPHGGPSLMERRGDAGMFLFSLLAQGIQPEFQILQRCSVEEGADAERRWIRKMAERGEPLLNSFDGGKTGARLADFLPHAAVARARKVNPEADAKRSAALRGRKLSAETRARMTAANRRRYENPEARQKLSNAQKRRWAQKRESRALRYQSC
jgi:hypothetical protein